MFCFCTGVHFSLKYGPSIASCISHNSHIVSVKKRKSPSALPYKMIDKLGFTIFLYYSKHIFLAAQDSESPVISTVTGFLPPSGPLRAVSPGTHRVLTG